MTLAVKVLGAGELRQLAKDLRDVDRADIRREMQAAIRRAAEPLKADARRRAVEILPHGGGFGERVARTPITVRTLNGVNAGVRLTARPGAVRDPGAINRGRARHPVYGRRPWVVQMVPPGWFTGAIAAGAPAVRAELVGVIDDIIRRLEA